MEVVVLRDVEPWLNGDHHSGAQLCVSVNQHRVVGVQPQIVAQVVGEQSPHCLETNTRTQYYFHSGCGFVVDIP